MAKLLTVEHIIIPKAIISNPASIFRTLLAFKRAMSRFDMVREMPAGSCPSTDSEVVLFLAYSALAASRSLHVFKNFAVVFVGGVRSSST